MSYFLLICIVVVWSATIPILHSISGQMPVALIMLHRFAISAILLLPFAKIKKSQIKNGLFMGLLAYLGYYLQGIGLKHGSATSGSLIIVLSVVFVPIISTIFFKSKIQRKDIVASAMCLCGILISFGVSTNSFMLADMITFGAMIINSIYMIVISKKSGDNVYSFAFWQMLFCSIFSLTTIFTTGDTMDINYSWQIIFLSIAATVFPIIAQPVAQKNISATSASIIFSTELAFALLFNFLYLGVLPTTQQSVGAFFICLAFLVTAFKK